MTERILAATDFSAAADAAVRAAGDQAHRRGGVLAVCHVVPNLMRAAALLAHHPEKVEPGALFDRDEAVRLLGQRVGAVTGWPPDAFEVLLEEGSPDAGIVAAAERWGATLVAVGGHGGADARPRLGRTADRVVRTAHCPVLVVREPGRQGPVLVATDFSDPALPAVASAVTEARWRGARLAILHSLDVVYAPIDASTLLSGGVPAPLSPELTTELRAHAEGKLREALVRHGIDGETLVSEGPPGPAIVEAAARLAAGLVVVGTTGKTGLARLLLGSVAERVMHDAPCSVLVVRLAAK